MAAEHPNWAAQGIGQAAVDFFVVMPGLLICALLFWRGSQRVIGIWQGLLLYVAYSYVLYSFFVHFSALFVPYIALLGLSVHLLIASVGAAEPPSFTRAQRRTIAGFLWVASVLFGALWLKEIIAAIAAGTTPQSALDAGLIVNPVHVLDLALFLPGLLITALLLRRGDRRGELYAIPLLAWSGLLGVFAWRRREHRKRAGILLGFCIAAAVVIVAYFIQYQRSELTSSDV